MTENPATEPVDDRDGVHGAPRHEPAQPYQPWAPQPYQPQPPPPTAPMPPAYPQPAKVQHAPPQPVGVPSAYPQPAPAAPAYVQPAAAAHPRPGYAPPPASVLRDSVAGPPGMRASAADRERAIDVCKASYGEGRLTKEEFDARVGQITASRTYGDLAVVTSDLPAGPLGGVSHYQAGGYPVPVPGYPPPVRPTNGLAIGSLVCSLMGISLPAVILGHIARMQIRERNEAGEGLAVAGLVVGWVGMALWTLLFVVLLAAAHH